MVFLHISDSAELYANTTTPVERSFLLLHVMVVTVLGMVGNIIVIIGSFAFQGHHNDKLSMVLFRNLAMADFLCVVVQVIPTLVVHIRKEWVWGEKMCLFIGVVRYVDAFLFIFTAEITARKYSPCGVHSTITKRNFIISSDS